MDVCVIDNDPTDLRDSSLRICIRRLVRNIKKSRAAANEAVIAQGDNEGKELELSSMGQVSSSRMSRSGGYWGWPSGDEESGGVGDAESGFGDDDDDGDDDSSLDSQSEEGGFTYEDLQRRTQAARAAVDILLPNRVDDLVGREGALYGLRRRRQAQQT